jgi:hypothetical protein
MLMEGTGVLKLLLFSPITMNILKSSDFEPASYNVTIYAVVYRHVVIRKK